MATAHDMRDASAFDIDNPDPRRWQALVVISVAQLMIVLDASIVNLALPHAKADLGISDADQQWVVTAYTLMFGGLLLLGGRVADYIGRKRAFMIGLVGFATASAIGGAAVGPWMLYGSRALQGVFAALLAPAALSLITVTFHSPKERARSFGVFGAISGGGSAVGLLLGGVLTEYLSWRWCLLINVPIALIALFLATRVVRESRATRTGSYDVAGALTVTFGLIALVYGFTKAAPSGITDSSHWLAAETLVWFGLALVLLVSFVIIELRQPFPLLPMRVVLDRNRGTSYLISLIVGIGLFAMFLFLGLYFQVVLGYSPVVAGFAFLPFSAGVVVGAGIASQLLPRFGPKPLVVPGLLFSAVGMLLLTRLTPESSYATAILPSMVILSVAIAFVFIPVASTSLHGVGHEDAGVASAMFNTTQQIGGAVGVALLNTVAVTTTAAYLATHGVHETLAGLTAGYTRAFTVGAILLAAAAIIAFVGLTVGKDAVAEGDEPVPTHLG